MINLEKYCEKIKANEKQIILDKKVNREIILFILFMVLGIFNVILLLIGAFYRDFIDNYKSLLATSVLIYIIVALIMYYYSVNEPLKELNTDDKLLVWFIYYLNKVKSTKKVNYTILKICNNHK